MTDRTWSASHFFSTARRSNQEGPLSGKALTPFIDQIKQAAFSRSRRRKAQLANPRGGRMPIDLLNLTNNRRALSREIMTCGH